MLYTIDAEMRSLKDEMNIMLWTVKASAVFLMLPMAACAAEILDGRYRIDMPVASISPVYESNEATPWGIAKAKTFHGKEDKGLTAYHFTRFDFPTGKKISPEKLNSSIKYFLRNRKCTASRVQHVTALDGDQKSWPQTTWTGVCAANGGYRNMQFIANGQLYEIGVSGKGPDLEQKLMAFMQRCRFIALKNNLL
jgi:hypothetical protein